MTCVTRVVGNSISFLRQTAISRLDDNTAGRSTGMSSLSVDLLNVYRQWCLPSSTIANCQARNTAIYMTKLDFSMAEIAQRIGSPQSRDNERSQSCTAIFRITTCQGLHLLFRFVAQRQTVCSHFITGIIFLSNRNCKIPIIFYLYYTTYVLGNRAAFQNVLKRRHTYQ